MSGATVPLSDRLIGVAPVSHPHDKSSDSFGMTSFVPRRVSEQPSSSEFSTNNAWNTNYNTANPGNQNNNNKNNANRARAVRRTEAPACNVTIEEIFQAYFDCRKHKRNSANAVKFEGSLERNLMRLHRELVDGSYQIDRSICFAVLYPTPREVWAADFRDRIVHHLIYNRIADKFYRRFIADNCACIPGRGTLYAATRAEHHLRSATQNWTQPKWVLQMDIANFFVSINKQILDAQLTAGIDDPYPLHLTRQVLHNDPTGDCIFTGNPANLKRIPARKSLFNAGGNGLPIGNLTSQLEANIHMDPIDQFAKRVLKLKHYVRYMDDIFIVGDSAEQMVALASTLTAFAKDSLALTFHPQKTHIQPAHMGVNFVGFILRPHARYLRRRTIAGAHQKIYKHKRNLAQSLNSYLGLMRHANCWRQRMTLAKQARRAGLRMNRQLTKVTTP